MALAAGWLATDNFDSYSSGASISGDNGGSGWTAAWVLASGTVTTSPAPSGMTNLAFKSIGSSSGTATRLYTSTTSGDFTFQIMTTAVSHGGNAQVVEAFDTVRGTDAFILDFDISNQIFAASNTAGNNLIGTYAINTVYTIRMFFTSTTFQVSINGGALSSSFACSSNNCTTNELAVSAADNINNPILWVDTIGPTPVIVPTQSFGILSFFGWW